MVTKFDAMVNEELPERGKVDAGMIDQVWDNYMAVLRDAFGKASKDELFENQHEGLKYIRDDLKHKVQAEYKAIQERASEIKQATEESVTTTMASAFVRAEQETGEWTNTGTMTNRQH
jgi:hypothetical protein